MGAATALWCACEEQNIDAIICDSPFISIKEVANDLVGNSWIFWGLSKILLPFLSLSLKSNVGYSISQVDMSKILTNGKIPALFIHALSDDLINIRQSLAIYSQYQGDFKLMVTPQGDHNSKRPRFVNEIVYSFVLRVLGIEGPGVPLQSFQDRSHQHFANLGDMMNKM